MKKAKKDGKKPNPFAPKETAKSAHQAPPKGGSAPMFAKAAKKLPKGAHPMAKPQSKKAKEKKK